MAHEQSEGTEPQPEVTKSHEILNVNRRSYPDPFGRRASTAVLVSGSIGDYAVYIGIGEAEFVRDHGDKLSFEEACCHFPHGLERERYRE